MRPPHLLQLQAVLQQTDELVGVNQRGTVFATDIASLDKCVECHHSWQHAEAIVIATMDQLQQLHRELDITQTTATELELSVAKLFGDVLDHTGAHALNIIDEGFPLRGGPHHRS